MIKLKGLEPFAAGGNRLCFVHPAFSERCIKVRRPDFTLEDLRRRKGFPHSLFPASRLDESVKENRILKACEKKQGEKLFEVVARNYGFVDTDMGLGLCSELIRNEDGAMLASCPGPTTQRTSVFLCLQLTQTAQSSKKASLRCAGRMVTSAQSTALPALRVRIAHL